MLRLILEFRRAIAEVRGLCVADEGDVESAERRVAIHGLTLIALGLSVLFLNSWDNLFVRVSVGFFWGAFLLIVNWGGVVQAFQFFKDANDRNRRSESLTAGR